MQMQMNLLSPDVQAERLARNRGAELAADHADRVQPGWSEQNPADWWNAMLEAADKLAKAGAAVVMAGRRTDRLKELRAR